MNNYRVNIKKDKYEEMQNDIVNNPYKKYYPLIREIRATAKGIGIESIWYFYEPYIEITWLGTEEQSELLFKSIDMVCNHYGFDHVDKLRPKDGNFGDWFCHSENEREFGCKTHSLCADFADLCHTYQHSIELGNGLREQVKRTIHRMCNPLNLSYKDEAYICFSRGLICLLFIFFKFNRAVWIYRKIFRQKYNEPPSLQS